MKKVIIFHNGVVDFATTGTEAEEILRAARGTSRTLKTMNVTGLSEKEVAQLAFDFGQCRETRFFEEEYKDFIVNTDDEEWWGKL